MCAAVLLLLLFFCTNTFSHVFLCKIILKSLRHLKGFFFSYSILLIICSEKEARKFNQNQRIKNKNNPTKLVIFLIFFLNILHLWFALESCWSSSKVFWIKFHWKTAMLFLFPCYLDSFVLTLAGMNSCIRGCLVLRACTFSP